MTKKRSDDQLLAVAIVLIFAASLGTLWILWLILKLFWKLFNALWKHFVTESLANKRFVRNFQGKLSITKSDFYNYGSFQAAAKKLASIDYARGDREQGSVIFQFIRKYRGVHAPKRFLVISNFPNVLIITPSRYWLCINNHREMGHTNDITATLFSYTRHSHIAHRDDEIIDQTWEHTTRSLSE